MNAQQLKNSILQEAIEGRLVPQDPNDEPASVLLDRIRKEKAKLVKEGKLKKKDLEETPISKEEIPFEIPRGWEWCRVCDISESFIGLTYKPSDVSEKGWIVLRSSNVQDGKIYLDDIVRVNVEIPTKLRVRENDIIICARNGSKKLVGKSAIVKCVDEPMTFGAFMAICRTSFYHYMSMYLLSPWFFEQLRKDSDTTTINQLTQKNFNRYLVPLPPLAEQHRIVAKIEELLPKVEAYGKAQEALDKLNADLPEQLKKSILQEAIEGRLVPQDPNEEPASVLLKPIIKDKKKQVKKEEMLFDIPDSWEWARLFDLIDVIYGFPFDSSKFNETKEGFPLIRIRDILPSMTKTYTTEKADSRYIIKKGDMIVGMDGNFNVRFWQAEDAYLNQRVCKITAKKEFLNQKYLYYYLPWALDEIFNTVSYVTVKHLSDKHLRSMVIPLPPLQEQHRIVLKIEQLLNKINQLKEEK